MISFFDYLFIIKKRFFKVKNFIFMIISSLLFLILFSSITVAYFSYSNKKEILNSDFGKTYIVQIDDEKIDIIKNIEHVKYVYSNKYLFQARLMVEEFNKDNNDGVILLKPLLSLDDVKIVNGNNVNLEYEIVCSDYFYPYEYDKEIYSYLFYRSNDIISKNITVVSQNEDKYNELINLNIVGTFKNKYMEEANVCYSSIDTYDSIVSKYMGYNEGYDDDGNMISRTPIEYNEYFIRIDDNKYSDFVLNELNENNIPFERYFYTDNQFLNNLFFIPLFIIIVSFIIFFCLLYSFISKKLNSSIKYYALLQSIGWEKNKVIIIELLENLFMLIISFIVSFVVYYLFLNYLSFNLLAELTYNSYILNCPFIFILLSFILIYLLIVIIETFLLDKYLDRSIYSLFNS